VRLKNKPCPPRGGGGGLSRFGVGGNLPTKLVVSETEKLGFIGETYAHKYISLLHRLDLDRNLKTFVFNYPFMSVSNTYCI
jgi:hypothetical protein